VIIEDGKLSIWVFSGDGGSVFKMRLRAGWAIVCCLVVSILASAALLVGGYSLYLRTSDDDAGWIARRTAEFLGKEASVQRALQRVKGYENELQQRLTVLQSLLAEAGEFKRDGSVTPGVSSGAVVDKAVPVEPSSWGGLGGGDDQALDFHSDLPLNFSNNSVGSYSENSLNGDAVNFIPQKLDLSRNTESFLSQVDAELKLLQAIPVGLPTQGAVNSEYGYRRSPFTRRTQMHSGVDVTGSYQSPVVANAEGVVIEAKYVGSYGNAVIVDHGNGYQTLYGHLSSINVKEGDRVCRGEQIGLLGSTGRSTGPHLHYEVRYRGKPINPKSFIDLAGKFEILAN